MEQIILTQEELNFIKYFTDENPMHMAILAVDEIYRAGTEECNSCIRWQCAVYGATCDMKNSIYSMWKNPTKQRAVCASVKDYGQKISLPDNKIL